LGSYEYLWKDSLGNELSIEQNISNLESGWYYLDVWDDHNCPYGDPFNGLKDSVQIYEPGALILSVDSIKHESYPGAKDGYIKISAQGGWPDNYQFRLENGNYSPSNIFQIYRQEAIQLKLMIILHVRLLKFRYCKYRACR
jgi:hypothetical protein